MSDSSDASSSAEASGAGSSLPTEGRLLGLDFGTKRLGVAVSDFEQRLACPLDTHHLCGDLADADFLHTVIDDYPVVGVVVGLPVHMSGAEGARAVEAREFGAWVARVTRLPVAYWDERFTSARADVQMSEAGVRPSRRRDLRDRLAACALLQSFLDADDRDQPPAPFPRQCR